MTASFTDYLTSLAAREGSPSREGLDLAWRALRAALVLELKRRGLWNSPPRYLGVHGAARWWQAVGTGTTPKDAVDELVGDCYVYVFVQRLRSLKAHLEVKGNVDGLVFLAIRNFVHDRQKASDPEGYRIFDLARQAIRSLLTRGTLSIRQDLAADGGVGRSIPPVRDGTVLTFDPNAQVPPAGAEVLENLVTTWNDDLMPGILTARYREKRAVREKLECHIARLPDAGVRAFRFRDLIGPLKSDTRARWWALVSSSQANAVMSGAGEGASGITPSNATGQHLEERDSFEKLAAAVAGAIDGLPELDSRTRRYLERLWRGLARHAAGLSLDAAGGRGSEDRPSNRELARSLGIPRDRLPGLLGILGKLVREYQASTARRVVADTLPSRTAERRPCR